jgi:hypothetical protein
VRQRRISYSWLNCRKCGNNKEMVAPSKHTAQAKILLWWLIGLATAFTAVTSAAQASPPSGIAAAGAAIPLTAQQSQVVRDAAALMAARGLTDEARLTNDLLTRRIWRAASPDDPYLADSEKAGDTPFAYTLSAGRHPSEIVLAPRFFTQTPTGRAALMLHELGHYRAYIRTGQSTELDGYKAEYDTHAKIGLSENDGLVYFSMLDGVVEFVVPHFPRYANYPDIKSYMAMSVPGK